MIEFPHVPNWWKFGSKFTRLKNGYDNPDYIMGFDTETCDGEIMTMQFSTKYGDDIYECNKSNALDKFFCYLDKYDGYIIVYCFNANFDLPQIFLKYVDSFQADHFTAKVKGYECKIFCSRNWFATFTGNGKRILFLDIHCYFSGSLASVSNAFGLSIKKLERPEGLGYRKFSLKDSKFVAYALMDSQLCYQMGLHIQDIHQKFDIPQAMSSANFAEKVFRRNFINVGDRLQFTPFPALRLAELTYHGGKNGYYLDTPSCTDTCYEYDFNSAYPCAMLELPSFLSGEYVKTRTLEDKYVGVYKYQGTIKECPYGSLFDLEFRYFRNVSRPVQGYATGFEIQEAIRSKELKLDKISGYVWKPSILTDSPLKRYVQFFWEQKNKLEKGTVQYLFAKLCLNSLYGKFVQRNPSNETTATISENFSLDVQPQMEVAGGLYHPFIGSLITSHTRSKLHKEEHNLQAIECSTDSVKSKKYLKEYSKNHYLGAMQLEHKYCKTCEKDTKKFSAIFVRNRLNVLMCQKGHVLKAALHGFWGKPEELKQMALEKRNTYEVYRMPMVREAMLHSGTTKKMFQMRWEERSLKIDWDTMVKL